MILLQAGIAAAFIFIYVIAGLVVIGIPGGTLFFIFLAWLQHDDKKEKPDYAFIIKRSFQYSLIINGALFFIIVLGYGLFLSRGVE